MAKPLVAAALVAAGALALSACANNTPAATPSAGGVQLVNPGKLTVCTHLAFKPFQFNEGGKIVGYDVT